MSYVPDVIRQKTARGIGCFFKRFELSGAVERLETI
jgi:hypothetical protein